MPAPPRFAISRTRLVIATAIVAIALVAVAGAATRHLDAQEIVTWLRSSPWAPVAFLVAYAVLNVAFVPTVALSIAAPLIWGWKIGGVIELFAATLAALPPYYLSRAASRRWIGERADDRWLEKLRREGFSALLILRLVPVIPYTALNYVAGAAGIGTRPYLLATFLGVIPSTFVFAYFVEAIVAGIMTPLAASLRVAGAGALLALLVVVTRFAARRLSASS